MGWPRISGNGCSLEIPLVNKPPRRLPAKSFYRSTTAQLGASSKTAPRKDIIHDKSRKACDSDTVAMSRADSGGRSKTSTLGQTPLSRQQKVYRKTKDGSSHGQVQTFIKLQLVKKKELSKVYV